MLTRNDRYARLIPGLSQAREIPACRFVGNEFLKPSTFTLAIVRDRNREKLRPREVVVRDIFAFVDRGYRVGEQCLVSLMRDKRVLDPCFKYHRLASGQSFLCGCYFK